MRSMVESKKKYEFLLGTIKSKCALLPRLLQFDPPDLTEEERDRLELVLHSNIQWKTIALGTSAVTILIAAIFNYFTEARILWVWCAIVIFFLFCQTLLFIYLNRRPTDLRVPALWSYATLIFFSSGSIAWYSLPWWLPAEPTVLKYAGITTAAAFFFCRVI